MFENKQFEEFRNQNLFRNEIDQIIKSLNQPNGFMLFNSYLKVRETLPLELLKPILISGMKCGGVSQPKFWMPNLIRIFSHEQIDKTLFEIIVDVELHEKCKLTNMFYWNSFRKIVRGTKELGVAWKWNGESYLEEYVELDQQEIKRQAEVFKEVRYRFLIDEFLKFNNLVYQYFISLLLPRTVDSFPNPLNAKAKKAIEIMGNEDFPNSANTLIEQVKGKYELEKILFEQLNWERK